LFCGNERSEYEDNYAIIDDSYLHWAENKAHDGVRVVLVIDVWHPYVTPYEREKIIELLAVTGK
jgi:aspartyl/asparaginyl beta-hydroxylase (cupin superfamily)